ncbi:MAG TPA: SDR family NAD(P)-dependent oxidoreductase [Methylocella sp.]
MRAVLITGANRGLGFEFASQYAADGWRVLAACRNPAAATELQCLAQNSKMLSILALDVTDGESVRTAATQQKDVAIDVLINSAGITGASGRTTGNVDYDSWANVFDVNTQAGGHHHERHGLARR